MVTEVTDVTEVVVMVKVALVLPAGTVTLKGSLAADELSLKETTTPPLGAGPLNVAVPWEVAPPVTLAGLNATETRDGAPVTDATVRATVATLLLVVPSFAL